MTPFVYILFLALFLVNVSSGQVHSIGRRHAESPVFQFCPNGFVRHDSSCYYASHDLATWTDALVYCQAYGAHLVYIESEREQQFVAAHIKNIQGGYYWIGGTDAITEGEWIWASIVKPIQYFKWSSGNPSNGDTGESHHQDCLAMYPSGEWDDGFCEEKHTFICEIELDLGGTQVIG